MIKYADPRLRDTASVLLWLRDRTLYFVDSIKNESISGSEIIFSHPVIAWRGCLVQWLLGNLLHDGPQKGGGNLLTPSPSPPSTILICQSRFLPISLEDPYPICFYGWEISVRLDSHIRSIANYFLTYVYSRMGNPKILLYMWLHSGYKGLLDLASSLTHLHVNHEDFFCAPIAMTQQCKVQYSAAGLSEPGRARQGESSLSPTNSHPPTHYSLWRLEVSFRLCKSSSEMLKK